MALAIPGVKRRRRMASNRDPEVLVKRAVLALLLGFMAAALWGGPPQPAGTPVLVSDAGSPSDGLPPLVTVLPDGRSVVVWTTGPADLEGPSVIFVRLLAADGTPQAAPARLHPAALRGELAVGLHTAAAGGYVVAWVEVIPRFLTCPAFVQSFRDDAAITAALQVNDPLDCAIPNAPIEIAENGGGWAVAWSSFEEADPSASSFFVFARLLAEDWTPLGPPLLLASSPVSPAPDRVALRGLYASRDGLLLAIYEREIPEGEVCDGNQLFARRYRGLNAAPVGGEIALFPGPHLCRDQFESAFAATPGGDATVAWTSAPGAPAAPLQASIFGGLLRADGAARQPFFQLSKSRSGVATEPALAVLPYGGFVAVWTDTDPITGAATIVGRSFVANAVPRTPDYRIDLAGASTPQHPAVAAAPGGAAVVVWSDSSGQVLARRLSPER